MADPDLAVVPGPSVTLADTWRDVSLTRASPSGPLAGGRQDVTNWAVWWRWHRWTSPILTVCVGRCGQQASSTTLSLLSWRIK